MVGHACSYYIYRNADLFKSDEILYSSRKSPRLTVPPLNALTPSQFYHHATPPESMMAGDDPTIHDENTYSFMLDAFMATEDTLNNCMGYCAVQECKLTQTR